MVGDLEEVICRRPDQTVHQLVPHVLQFVLICMEIDPDRAGLDLCLNEVGQVHEQLLKVKQNCVSWAHLSRIHALGSFKLA